MTHAQPRSARRLAWCPSWASTLRGKMRRRAGYYDAVTLACLRKAWLQQPELRTLLDYLRVRRDCGHASNPVLLNRLAGYLPAARGRDLHRAANQLLEAGRSDALAATSDAALQALTLRSPPIAWYVKQSGAPLNEDAELLAEWHASQEALRTEFAAYLRKQAHSICVVGNGPALQGTDSGPAIDEHSCVIRFNRYAQEVVGNADYGRRLDIWVRSPGLDMNLPDSSNLPGWVVLSGCDVRYQLAHWEPVLFLLRAGCRVLTVPTDIWNKLVRQFGAPPSAGVLMLVWLLKLRGDSSAITIAGFQDAQYPVRATRPLPGFLPLPARGGRHNWSAELAWLQQQRDQGLAEISPE